MTSLIKNIYISVSIQTKINQNNKNNAKYVGIRIYATIKLYEFLELMLSEISQGSDDPEPMGL
jgi:hypothetical protein